MDRFVNPWKRTLASEQQVVDCKIGCTKGAFTPNVFKYIREADHCDSTEYRYINEEGICEEKKCRHRKEKLIRISGVHETEKSKNAIKNALSKGIRSVAPARFEI